MIRGFSLLRLCSGNGRIFRRNLSYYNTPGSDPLQYATIGHLLERSAQRFGDREALVSFHEDVRLSYRDLLQHADRIAAGFLDIGLRPGERIAIWGPNGWQWVVSRLAAARAGLVSVDVNPLYVADEVRHCLQLGKVAAVVSPEEHRSQRYNEILAKLVPELRTSSPGAVRSREFPHLRTLVTLSDKNFPGAVRYKDLVAAGTAERIKEVQSLQNKICPDADLSIQFSSGTTGKPKAILIGHQNVVNNSYFIGKRLGIHEKEHKMSVQTPLFHAYGTVIVMFTALQHGATLVLPYSSYSPMKAVEAAIKERCTIMTGTPTMHVDTVKAVEELGQVPPALELVVSGGASMPPELVRRIMSTLKIKRICNVYGLSEVTAVAFQNLANDSEDQMANTVGKVGDYIQAKVVDENGQLVPFGTPGELLIRGYGTMKEYYDNPEATSATVQEGWLRTGDTFVLSEDGYGQVVGRIKDVIIRGGENIYPAEIESVLLTHPCVAEAQVVSVPDERLGEEVCACIRLRDSKRTVDVARIREFCKDKMAKFKVPRYITVLDDFPKTQSGKIQKFRLRELCNDLVKAGNLQDSRTLQ